VPILAWQEPNLPKNRFFSTTVTLLPTMRGRSVKFGRHTFGVPIFPCRAGFYTLPKNFLSARYKTAPYIKPNFPCRAGFYTLPTNFSSARCKTAPYIEPIFPCRAGFYTLPTNFHRRGIKPRPTSNRFSSRSGSNPTLQDLFRLGGAKPSEFYEFRFSSEGMPLACRIFWQRCPL